MPNKPYIPYQQFIQKYASEFYLTERKRKAYYPRLISTILGTFSLITAITTIALNISNKVLGQWLFVSISFIFLGGLILGIHFWNQFRLMHKERILKMLIEEYFPTLTFNYRPEKYRPSGFYKPSNYLDKIGYWPEYKFFTLGTQDFIEGPIGQLEIILFEALVQHRDKGGNLRPVFDGIILEIQNIPPHARLDSIKSRDPIKKALNTIFDFYQNDYPTLFASPNGNWYLFLEHSKTYLEPKGIKKSWSQEELERLLGEFYYFIQFAEILNAELGEDTSLPEAN